VSEILQVKAARILLLFCPATSKRIKEDCVIVATKMGHFIMSKAGEAQFLEMQEIW